MSSSPDRERLDESYRYCHFSCRKFQSNFFKAFSLLPRNKRQAMCVLYAFNRLTDDLADASFEADFDGYSSIANAEDAARIALPHKQRRIRWWRSMFRLALQHDFTEEDERICLNIQPDTDLNLTTVMILPSLIDMVEHYQIPRKYLIDVIDGVEMDLTKNRYQTFAELQLYCERVASAVGLACIHIWGFEGRGKPEAETVFELARKVGIAYQLTNILRDVKEDAALDRVYLPLEEISAAGYSVEELKNGIVNPAFEKLMRTQLDRTEDYYRAGRELYARLKPDGKKIFGLMTATYHAISKKIAAHPAAVFTKRIRPGAFARLRLIAKWTCFTPRELIL